MTWQIASLGVLAFVLATGALWYERSHPSAKVLALVAALAALAALGRIAFAPLPNVKPTTDIVLLAGIALGGAPAFAVGAIAALASNVFFGQGWWTPWQMVAWGLVGVAGAGVGMLPARWIERRVPLALICAVAGLGFGAIMNLSTWTAFVGEQTGESYAAIAVTALPFDIAHAVGNFVFALAFGPALLRSLRRFRSRFEVRWSEARPVGAALTAGAVALVLAVGATAAIAPPSAEAASSAQYLERAQNGDGGWGAAPGQGSTQLHTGWIALGLAADGRNPLDVRSRGETPISYMRRGIATLGDAGELERTILVLVAAGVSPRDFGGRNLVADLLRRRRGDGSIDGFVSMTSFGVLALRAAGRSTGDRAVRTAGGWIVRQQNPDGGFSFARRGGASGIDDTSGAVQGLVAGGRGSSSTVRKAIAFLKKQQNPDGGFPLQPGGASNAQSTSWATQALVAAEIDPDRVRRGGRSPLGYLRSLTASNGSVRYSRTSTQTPSWVTGQALAALARKPFPLARVPRERSARVSGADGDSTPAVAASATSAATTPSTPSEPAQRDATAREDGESKAASTGDDELGERLAEAAPIAGTMTWLFFDVVT